MIKRLSTLLVALLAASQLTACFPLIVAGAATGVAVSQDRRATAVVWNDQQIERRIAEKISAKYGSLSHVNVTSFNRSTVLTGEVPDDATRADIERMARETPDVKQVYNELAVMLPSSLSARTADTALTTKVKARMLDANRFSTLHVKVVSERSQVFLMGLVKQQEARDAAQIASQTPGTEKVVTLFEYMD